MKTTNFKSIYLTKDEVKSAIIAYLVSRGDQELSEHLVRSACIINWAEDIEELIISTSNDS